MEAGQRKGKSKGGIGAGRSSIEPFRKALRVPRAPSLLEELETERALEACWKAVQPLVVLRAFEEAADDLRASAARVAVNLGCPLIETQLEHGGYDFDDIDEIRSLVDVFHYQDAKLLLLTAVLARSIEGSCGGARGSGRSMMRIPAHLPEGLPEVKLVDEQAAGVLDRCFVEASQRLGLGRVPDDFRALGRWPKYLEIAWSDARRRDEDPEAREAHEDLCMQADAAAEQLPVKVCISEADLRAAGADPARVRALLKRYRAALSELTVDLALFKVQLDGAEDAVDSPFAIDWEYLANDDYLPDNMDEDLKLRAGDPTGLDDESLKVENR